MLEVLRQARSLFEKKERRKALVLFALLLFGAAFEALGIGLVMPFIALVANPAEIATMPLAGPLFAALGITEGSQVVITAGLLLLLVFIVKNLYLGLMYFLKYRFLFANQVHLSRRLFKAYLHSPYAYHLDKNTAQQLRNVNDEVRMSFGHVIIPLFTLAVEFSVVAVLGLMLLLVEPVVAPVAMASFGLLSYSFYRVVRKKSAYYGEEQQHHGGLMIQWVQQGLGGIKESKLAGCEDYFLDHYQVSSARYARSMRFHRFIKELPRTVIETFGLGGMILVVVLLVARGQDMEAILPVLGLFAVAAVRLLPSMTRIIAAVTSIRHFRPSLELIASDLASLESLPTSTSKSTLRSENVHENEGNKKEEDALVLHKELRFEKVSYSYPGEKKRAIKDLSLCIERGERVAFVGPSGAGKTTVVDLLLGLLTPERGAITVDNRSITTNLRSWQDRLGYIAQPTYLLDDSIRRNIAFGIPDDEINDDHLWEAITDASLADLIGQLPQGLDTRIGEGGIRFSGGQRQRIGIARALYKKPDLLVLDEATSALDNQTESEITAAISALSREKTVVLIAHRLSTVRNCDQLFFLSQGELLDQGTFEELLFRNQAFYRMVQAALPSSSTQISQTLSR